MLPCTSLNLKMLNQCTHVRFMHVFKFALATIKFLGQ